MITATDYDYSALDMLDYPDPVPQDANGDYELPVIEDDGAANDHLRHLRHWREERARIEEQTADEIAKLKARSATMLMQIDRHIGWHEAGLAVFLTNLGQRAWKGLQGSISWRAGRQSIGVADESVFFAWARQQPIELQTELVRVKVEPNKTGLAKWLKGGADVPPGIELVQGDQTLAIQV